MKFGIKIYYDKETAEYFKDKADFLEVMAISGKDYGFLENYPLPIVVHAEHHGFGVNAADSVKRDKNLKSINFAIELADRFKSDKIILHPGCIENESCSKEEAISFFKGLDGRIIIENLPNEKERGDLCLTPEKIKSFINKCDKGICFDVVHGMQSAIVLKKDCVKMIRDFIKLKPQHYHLSGMKMGDPWLEGGHLSFEDADMPLKEILELFPEDAEVTLEVSMDIKKIERDLELVRKLVL